MSIVIRGSTTIVLLRHKGLMCVRRIVSLKWDASETQLFQ